MRSTRVSDLLFQPPFVNKLALATILSIFSSIAAIEINKDVNKLNQKNPLNNTTHIEEKAPETKKKPATNASHHSSRLVDIIHQASANRENPKLTPQSTSTPQSKSTPKPTSLSTSTSQSTSTSTNKKPAIRFKVKKQTVN